MVATATYMKTDWWNWTFLKGIYIERKFNKQELQTPSRFGDMLWYRWGGTKCPLAWIGLNTPQAPSSSPLAPWKLFLLVKLSTNMFATVILFFLRSECALSFLLVSPSGDFGSIINLLMFLSALMFMILLQNFLLCLCFFLFSSPLSSLCCAFSSNKQIMIIFLYFVQCQCYTIFWHGVQ